MNPPAYLNELLHFANNKEARKEKTIQLMSRKYTLGKYSFDYTTSSGHNGGTSHAHSVFGTLVHRDCLTQDRVSTPENFAKYSYFTEEKHTWKHTYSGKNGIEILGAEPNAKGTTFSRKCLITVPELKKACKENGIKTTGMDKRKLLHALMKI